MESQPQDQGGNHLIPSLSQIDQHNQQILYHGQLLLAMINALPEPISTQLCSEFREVTLGIKGVNEAIRELLETITTHSKNALDMLEDVKLHYVMQQFDLDMTKKELNEFRNGSP